MRLLKSGANNTLTFANVDNDSPPKFAILSHTWGREEDEVTFNDVISHGGRPGFPVLARKIGYEKLAFCLAQAAEDGLEYVWIDTCCINKDSQTELNKAINWMFRWYAMATRCYVFLADVPRRDGILTSLEAADWQSDFRCSRWFTRGWTLQELLAPETVEFFSKDGTRLGDRAGLADSIHSITGIPMHALDGQDLTRFSIQERFNWALARKTKEPEDHVYCQFGILGVSFPPNYGEGKQTAMKRLRAALVESYAGDLLILDFHQSLQRRDRVRNIIATQSSTVTDSSDMNWLQELRMNLDFPEMYLRKSAIQKNTARTCTWLLELTTYKHWLHTAEPGSPGKLLWIKGKPGAGKSTLIKFAADEAVSNKATDEIIISFYFNARGATLERTVEGMYRSLLGQLMDAAEAASLSKLAKLLEPHKTVSTASNLSVNTLQIFFSAMANSLGHRQLTIFIDALDECRDEEVREMLYFLEDLGKRAVDNGRHVRMCFASRYYPTIVLPSAVELKLEEQQGHSDDLRIYVNKALHVGNDERAHRIVQTLLAKANGVFIWAVLVIKMLNFDYERGQIMAMLEKLESLPPDMSSLFNFITHRDTVDLDDFVLCLQWILFAQELLTPESFYSVMTSSFSRTCRPSPQSLGISKGDIERYVAHSSKGLAEIVAGRVQFIHETVRDFLLVNGGLQELCPTTEHVVGASHERLKTICITWLESQLEVWNTSGSVIGPTSGDANPSQSPALTYAANCVILHAEQAAEHFSQEDFLRKHKASFWIEFKKQDRLESRLSQAEYVPNSLLHMLVQDDAGRLIGTALELGIESVEVTGFNLTSGPPLANAVVYSKMCAVQVLIDHGANMFARDTIDRVVVQQVMTSTDAKLVQIFLKRLQKMSPRKHECVTIDPDIREKVFKTNLPANYDLMLAATSDGLTAAETSQHDMDAAIRYCSTKILRKMLANNAHAKHCKEAILRAVRINAFWNNTTSRREIIDILLASGADMEAKDTWGCTALLIACRKQTDGVVSLLLECGANIHAQDDNGNTALMHAVHYNAPEIVYVLLRHDANVNVVNARGKNVLDILKESDLERNHKMKSVLKARMKSSRYSLQSPLPSGQTRTEDSRQRSLFFRLFRRR